MLADESLADEINALLAAAHDVDAGIPGLHPLPGQAVTHGPDQVRHAPGGRIAEQLVRALGCQLVDDGHKIRRIRRCGHRRAGGKVDHVAAVGLAPLEAVQHHAVGIELKAVQRQHEAAAAVAALDITIGLQQVIGLFHRGHIHLIFAAHKPVGGQHLSRRDIAPEDLGPQLCIDLLIQAFSALSL